MVPDFSPIIDTKDETLQQTRKWDSFCHDLQRLANVDKYSGSLLSRTTTGIQSGPDAFNESKFIIMFLTNIGVTGILRSLRLALEAKPGKDIPEPSRLELSEMVSANNFAVSYAEKTTQGN